MGSRAMLTLRASAIVTSTLRSSFCSFNLRKITCPKAIDAKGRRSTRTYSSSSTKLGLQPPDVSRLAETARISLTPHEVEDFAPKIRQVIDWFGQLQSVDLQSIEPAIRADTEGDNIRDDIPETFDNREAMIAAVPSYEDAYIKVPKVLNKE